jgi:ribosome-associated protein
MAGAFLMANFKSNNIKIFTATDKSLCDYNIIASAPNSTAAGNLATTLVRFLRSSHTKIVSLEGMESGQWVLIDTGDIIFHIFSEEARAMYDLDSLWIDDTLVQIPTEYYNDVSPESIQESSEEHSIGERDYF